ncbi:MAG: signal peptidase I [Pseudomonadota bacterium]
MTLQAILSNFALILFVLMVLTGIVWFLDIFYFAKQRRLLANKALAAFDERNAKLAGEGIKVDNTSRQAIEAAILRQPTWIEYSGSFFPVIALVFFLRSFLYEPFKIPSTSMVPTLLVGDLILVNKFTYGVRLPILNQKIIEVNDPQRGDVMVFKYPKDMSQDYIKRVVGVPGDTIVYENKRLTVNGKAISYTQMDDYLDDVELLYHKQYTENLTGVAHKIITRDSSPTINVAGVENFPQRSACDFSTDKFTCIVPPGNYFMMGDNRDNSQDSRFWGFVPNKNIVGKAFFVWMNFGNLGRIGGIN